jgi:hypothetical protein
VRALLVLVSALVVALCVVPLGLGVCLLVTPDRAGNFLNEAFAIFPTAVGQGGGTRWFYRALGVGCLALSCYLFRQIWGSLVLPVMQVLQ